MMSRRDKEPRSKDAVDRSPFVPRGRMPDPFTLVIFKKTEIPMGEHRWLTVVGPDDPHGVELLLEPDAHPAARPFKRALVEDGIPFTSFAVKDVRAEYERLRSAGVRFTQPPVDMGPVATAVLDDTCGNLIQIAQKK